MKKVFILVTILFLAGCSSADLKLGDLKENYPESFAEPIESFSQKKQATIGLPSDLPFEVSSVEATTEKDTVEVHYQSDRSHELTVRTIFNPGNILKESELQIPLDTGAVAGVLERKDHVFVEWYNSENDVVYQVEYSGVDKEKRSQQAMEIANAI